MVLTITLLGGESTGKSTLAHALQNHLNHTVGLAAVRVPEHLRTWCETKGRAPHSHEQAERAHTQTRLINQASQQPGVRVVIADTTALMVAAYSELYFNDTSLYPVALAQQRHYSLSLLMGLDLPWVADGLFRDSPAVREATDTVLRRELQAAGIGFQTVYGQGDARLHQALRAIGPLLGESLVPTDRSLSEGRVAWNCEKCSDPACERRLFSQLLQRQTTPETPA
ncbi:MAG: ATP-binding protein [Hydrogenophaga sp.]|uniref:ATP-binding protein n=1 Tax=Hydrogenophaga sp. TaxID=1904254 RepID=UPI002775B34B|nr:ATP-binding protein [Hydrogenophaga sp.]MDP2416105.1 ATP-binding protein [Hydrogenophaga sp.]MDZ4186791.1 ATP-binding protein [Hydrogenophaga sp.]